MNRIVYKEFVFSGANEESAAVLGGVEKIVVSVSKEKVTVIGSFTMTTPPLTQR